MCQYRVIYRDEAGGQQQADFDTAKEAFQISKLLAREGYVAPVTEIETAEAVPGTKPLYLG
jgi:hypothetical protein